MKSGNCVPNGYEQEEISNAGLMRRKLHRERLGTLRKVIHENKRNSFKELTERTDIMGQSL